MADRGGRGSGGNEVTRPDLPVRIIPGEKVDSQLEDGIALCLSGGGYRAMIFHVGALWRLNEAGLLSKLTRVSSVSGGSITAGVLGLHWKHLKFDDRGVVQNLNIVFDAVRAFARRTVDAGSVIGGLLLPGTIGDKVAKAYNKHLFQDATLQDLPADGEGPRFVINATNVQTGSLWRFSRPYMGDWQVGLIRNPTVPLARAVAASSAFPPVLSPVALDVSPGDFNQAPKDRGRLADTAPYNDEVVLSDGGVYDNLGLETAFKRCRTLLVSDAGQKMGDDPHPKGDWAQHAVRVMGLLDNQVRSLRKRILINAYRDKTGSDASRTGAYWGIASEFKDYLKDATKAGGTLADPLGIGGFDPKPLAEVKTRLKAMPDDLQERLINWGYAVCDTALRMHFAADAKAKHGVTINTPGRVPYPGTGL